MTKEEKLKAIKKYLKDNWVEILIYFILLGGFVSLAIANLVLNEWLTLLKGQVPKTEQELIALNKLITKYEGYIRNINYPIGVLTGLNLLFTPHKLYGSAKQPIKNMCIRIHRKRKKVGVITER